VTSLDESIAADLHREARARWPEVYVTPERFREVLATALAASAARSVKTLHASDLYLVAACLDGDARAVEVLRRDVVEATREAVKRAARVKTSADDAVQATLAKLLVGPPEPKLRQYTGKGPLVAWTRVIAVREALQLDRRTKREVVTDADLAGMTSAASVELGLVRELHGPAFGAALQQAIARLSPEQRTLLRFHVKDGLTIDQLAPMLGIHRATAARRLERARADVLAHTQDVLREQHGLSDSEVRSLCIALAGEVDISVGRALGDEAPT